MDRRHSRHDTIRMILPTGHLFDEYKLVEHVFYKLPDDGYTLEDIAEYVLGQWSAMETEWQSMYRLPDLTTYEKIINFLYTDFLSDRQLATLDHLDALALKHVVVQFAMDFYREIMLIMQGLSLTDFQIETLEIGPWIGRSMVIIVRQ